MHLLMRTWSYVLCCYFRDVFLGPVNHGAYNPPVTVDFWHFHVVANGITQLT